MLRVFALVCFIYILSHLFKRFYFGISFYTSLGGGFYHFIVLCLLISLVYCLFFCCCVVWLCVRFVVKRSYNIPVDNSISLFAQCYLCASKVSFLPCSYRCASSFLIEGKSCLFMSIQEMKFLVMVLLIMTRYFELQKQWNVHVLFSPYPFQSWQKLLLSGYYNFLSFSLSSFSTRCLQFMRLFFDIGASSMCC